MSSNLEPPGSAASRLVATLENLLIMTLRLSLEVALRVSMIGRGREVVICHSVGKTLMNYENRGALSMV